MVLIETAGLRSRYTAGFVNQLPERRLYSNGCMSRCNIRNAVPIVFSRIGSGAFKYQA
jgi:hypothetical protein